MRNLRIYLPLMLSTFAACLYLFTASPAMLWLDAARFVAAMVTLGVSNPPEPLYVMIGHLFTKLPFGTMIFKIQILSALLAFSTLVAVYWLTIKVFNKFLDKMVLKVKANQKVVIYSAAFSLLTLAFSYQFWSQAQNIETFILVSLMVAITLMLLIGITNRKNFFTHMAFMAGMLGLGSGTNPVLASVGPPILFVLWTYKKYLNPQRFFILGAISVSTFILIHLYIPWAASRDPFLSWGRATNLQGIIEVSTGAGLNVYVPELNRINGFTGSPIVFATSVWHYFEMLWIKFTPIMLPFIFIGMIYLWQKNKYVFKIFGLTILTNIILAGLYLSGNQESWFLVSDVVFAVCSGLGFYALVADWSAIKDFFVKKSKDIEQYGLNLGPVNEAKLLINYKLLATIKTSLANLNLKKTQSSRLPSILFAVVFIPLWFWWPVLDRREWYLLEDYVNNLYRNIKGPAILFGSADLFDSMSFYVHDVVATCQSGFKSHKVANEASKSAGVKGKENCIGTDVVPVTDNILYMLEWYRNNLIASADLKMPDDTNLKYDTAEEYSKYVNDFFEINMDKYRIYIDQPALRNNFMSRADQLPSLKIDETKFRMIPRGMVYEIVKVTPSATGNPLGNTPPNSPLNPLDPTQPMEVSASVYLQDINLADFEFKFKTKNFPRKQPVMLEKVYKGELVGMINEYALSLEGLGDYFLKNGDAPNALTFYQKAYAFNPKNAEIVSRLGNYYGSTGDARKAGTYFKKAIEIEPTNVGYKFNLAISYLNMGQVNQAKETLREIIKDTNAISPIAQQAKMQLDQLESLDSGEIQLPEGWQKFTSENLNLSFAYPEGFEVKEVGKDQVKLSNNGQGKDELTLTFYSQKLKEGEDLEKLEAGSPIKMDGLLVNTQPLGLVGFQSQVKMYANGKDLSLLMLLSRNNQGFVVQVVPGDSNLSQEFSGVVQSIRLVK